MTSPTYSMEDLKKRIQEQTVVSMGMMMPEEHLKSLVDEAINDFFRENKNWVIRLGDSGNYYRQEVATTATAVGAASPFKMMIWDKVTNIVKKILDTYFEEQAEEIVGNNNEATLSDEFKLRAGEGIARLAPVVAETQALQAMQRAVEMLRGQVNSELYRHGMNVNLGN